MKTIQLTLILISASLASFAQVGIGNTDPKASLDITASNAVAPSNTDGILIPKIDNFPGINPGTDQNGMLVFVTGNGTPIKGFYYWDNALTSWVDVIGTKNTLEQAYNEGGAGAGKNINASDGAIRINGTDGLLVTGYLNSGDTIDTEVTGAGVRMFFNPNTGSFRAGEVNGAQWNHANLGDRSVAFGNNNTASGNSATALGANNVSSGNRSLTIGDDGLASGQNSVAMGDQNDAIGINSLAQGFNNTASGTNTSTFGVQNNAPSYGEMTVGTFASTYTQNSLNSWNTGDRIFTIGNGQSNVTRSNALTVYKNGLININDAYNMPLTDGSANQVMTTDGAGNVTFQNVATATDTDDQQIDVLNLNGTNLEIFLQGDGVATQTLDLSSLSGAQRINDLIDGKSDNDGTDDGSSIFLGIDAGASDSGTDNRNIGIGFQALFRNTSGLSNIATGNQSLYNNTSGSSNIAIGSRALFGNTTGVSNVAIGTSALQNNTTGRRNIGIGFYALRFNTSGESNIGIGYTSLDANTTGRFNTAIGVSTLNSNTTGSDNTAYGYRALSNNNTGSYNTVLGAGALTSNSTGSNNIAIGYNAGSNSLGSNQLIIENSSSSTPLIYGTFNTNEVGINWDSSVALPNTLSVNGNASKTTAGAWLANSDARLKKDIKTMNSQAMLNKILAMRGVTYKWDDDKTGLDRPESIQYGFIAQDLQKIWPTKVSEDGQGFLQTAYGDYDAMFVEAFKAQQAQIQTLKQENKTLTEKLNKLEQLEARLSALEANSTTPN